MNALVHADTSSQAMNYSRARNRQTLPIPRMNFSVCRPQTLSAVRGVSPFCQAHIRDAIIRDNCSSMYPLPRTRPSVRFRDVITNAAGCTAYKIFWEYFHRDRDRIFLNFPPLHFDEEECLIYSKDLDEIFSSRREIFLISCRCDLTTKGIFNLFEDCLKNFFVKTESDIFKISRRCDLTRKIIWENV